MSKSTPESTCPANRQEWRTWLEEHHQTKQGVWLIYYRKNTGKPTLTWSEAVDEALCFGWIDSTKRSIDEERYMQYFSRRKARSFWSKINKDKVQQLTEAGLMTEAGLNVIQVAKDNGYWTLMDQAEALIIPDDLEKEFQAHPGAKDYFLSLSKSARRSILHWLVMARREETRKNRIDDVVQNATQKRKPKPLQ